MGTKIENEKDNIVSITITIPAKEAERAYDNAATRIAQQININGFRRGK